MQGNETEASIIAAFDRIAGKINLFDVVVIVRGGGSQSDLSWFDNYAIAYHITQFPLPVITGIGHEKDLSVSDMVAFRSEKTPTAVADFLIGSVLNADEHLMQLSSELSNITLEIIGEFRERLINSKLRLIPAAKISVASERENLGSMIISLVSNGKDYLLRERSQLVEKTSLVRSGARAVITLNRTRLKESSKVLPAKTLIYLSQIESLINNFSTSLGLLNPLNVLKRGYTITSLKGKIIISSHSAEPGDIIDTQFADGTVSSIVNAGTSPAKK
jgi:exodeoxyribonuclease VII large subunit